MCDPENIVKYLRRQGYNVVQPIHVGEIATRQAAIKSARVFIACISDAYVNDENCTREFQYAKATLKKPIIPLVVGDGSFEWMETVIGMLIAGELFIHFSGLDVETDKLRELSSNLKKLINIEEGSNTSDGVVEQVVTKEEEIITRSLQEPNTPPDVFLSYCWKNSYRAEDAKQMSNINGSRYSDPRLFKDMITNLGYNVWLDIEQLHTAKTEANLFGQIVEGLKSAKVVVTCISDDYSQSQNCRMEFQFALKSLQKPVIPLVVGKGDDWKLSVIGALIVTHHDEPINLQNITSKSDLDIKFEEIKNVIKSKMSKDTASATIPTLSRDAPTATIPMLSRDGASATIPKLSRDGASARIPKLSRDGASARIQRDGATATIPKLSRDAPSSTQHGINAKLNKMFIQPQNLGSANSTTIGFNSRPQIDVEPYINPIMNRVPQPGDHVISLYVKWAYFMATVVSYNRYTMTFTINWDDGGRRGREQPFNQVAKDFPPERDDIGVGTLVFFPQGSYGATEGENEGGVRYHEGEVTHVTIDSYGCVLVSGTHTKDADDGKWVTYRRYNYYFNDIPLSHIRLAPTALEAAALQAMK